MSKALEFTQISVEEKISTDDLMNIKKRMLRKLDILFFYIYIVRTIKMKVRRKKEIQFKEFGL